MKNQTPSNSFALLLYGILLFLIGLALYLCTSFAELIALLAPFPRSLVELVRLLRLCGSASIWTGLALATIDLFVLLPHKRQEHDIDPQYLENVAVTVVLTAYNDELSIGLAVKDFSAHPRVRRVIVVDNNSRDRTAEVAENAGATVVLEKQQGYGHCVFRALSEGLAANDADLTLLCEGDMTFRAYDIDKFLAYIPHADIVNGTRIVEQLRLRDTQLTTFMYYGNFFVGKLLEAKHIGHGTFTDVGTTYKLCRNSALRRLLPLLNPQINLAFNAHFLDRALFHEFRLLECPVTFHNRVGVSKGGNVNDWRAFRVGMAMIKGIVLGWNRS
jgi:glycosyltransferase involved in cell wall biosynthesis